MAKVANDEDHLSMEEMFEILDFRFQNIRFHISYFRFWDVRFQISERISETKKLQNLIFKRRHLNYEIINPNSNTNFGILMRSLILIKYLYIIRIPHTYKLISQEKVELTCSGNFQHFLLRRWVVDTLSGDLKHQQKMHYFTRHKQ